MEVGRKKNVSAQGNILDVTSLLYNLQDPRRKKHAYPWLFIKHPVGGGERERERGA